MTGDTRSDGEGADQATDLDPAHGPAVLPDGLRSRRDVAVHLLSGILAAAFGVGLVLLVAWRMGVGWADLRAAMEGADRVLLGCILLGSLLFHAFVGGHKTWYVLRVMGVRVGLADMFRLRMAGAPFRILFPLGIGEALRVLFFWRYQQMTVSTSMGAVAFDRGLNGVGAVGWLLAGGVLVSGPMEGWPVLGVVALTSGFLLMLFVPSFQVLALTVARRVHPRLGRFADGVLLPFRHSTFAQKVLLTAYGVFFQSRPLLVCYALFLAFGVHPDSRTFLLLASLVVFAGHVPVAAGLGSREAALVLLFHGTAAPGVLVSVGLWLTLTLHIVPTLVGVPWCPWLLRRVVHPVHAETERTGS